MANLDDTAIDEVDLSTWTEITSCFYDLSFEQTGAYALAMARYSGAEARFLVVRRAGEVVGAAAVRLKRLPLLGYGVAYVSGGPIVARNSFANNVNYLRSEVVRAIRMKLVEREGHLLYVRFPLIPSLAPETARVIEELGFRPTQRVRSYRTVAVDLLPAEDVLRARLDGKWRTDLNYAEKSNLAIEQGTGSAIFQRFLRIFDEMKKNKGFDLHVDPRFFLSIAPEDIGLNVMIATKDGKDAAGHVLSCVGDCAVYLFGASNEVGRASKTGYLLNWMSMLYAKRRGVSWYDLGGVDKAANPGGYRFKQRMGGQDLTALGPFEAVPPGMVGRMLDLVIGLRDRLRDRPGI